MPGASSRDRRVPVCIVRHNYYPDTHVRRDAEALAQAGYDVSVVALRRPNQPARETLNGVDVHRMPVGEPCKGLRAGFRVRALLPHQCERMLSGGG